MNIDPNSCVTCRCAPPQSDKLITHFLNRLPDRSSSVATPCVCICLTPNSEPEKPLTSTHLGEHGQFFGKVDDTGDGRSDDLGELAEGLQVHLVSVWRGGDRGLADFVWLRGDRDAGRLIRKQSQPDVDLSRGSPMRGRAEVNKCQKKRDDNNELIPSSRVLLFVWSRSHTVLLTTEPNVYQSAAENSPKQMHLT